MDWIAEQIALKNRVLARYKEGWTGKLAPWVTRPIKAGNKTINYPKEELHNDFYFENRHAMFQYRSGVISSFPTFYPKDYWNNVPR